mgnify:FL=1
MFETIARVIAAQKGISPSAVTMDSRLEELRVDSLDAVDILMALEDEFSVKLNLRRRLATVAEVVDAVEQAIADAK